MLDLTLDDRGKERETDELFFLHDFMCKIILWVVEKSHIAVKIIL